MVVTYIYKGLIDEEVPKDVEEVKFADNVTVIRRYAFRKCKNLKKVEIPNHVRKIEEYAFFDCTDLSSVVINGSVKVVEFRAFRNCDSLEQLILLNGVEEINILAFSWCQSLRSVFIPESVRFVGDFAFASCSNFEYVVIMTSENQIIDEETAFDECRSLKRIFKISIQELEQKISVIAKYLVGFETLKRLLDIDCKGVQCSNAERLYPFMAQACISNLDQKHDADHLSSIYYLLRRDPSFCFHC